MIDLRLIKCFLEVADVRSFSAAAVRLGIAQSAASTHVRRLEDVLRFRLFARTSRHVELTPEGRAFLPHAEALIAAEAATRQVAREIADQGSKRLRVGTYQFVAKARLRVMSRYIGQFPRDEITIHYGSHGELLNKLRRGSLDVVIALTVPDEAQSEVIIHPLWPIYGHLVVPADGELADRTELVLPMLSGASIAVLPSSIDSRAVKYVTDLLTAQGVHTLEAEETDRDATDAYARARGIMHLRWLARRKERHFSDGWAVIPISDEAMQLNVAALHASAPKDIVQRFLSAVTG